MKTKNGVIVRKITKKGVKDKPMLKKVWISRCMFWLVVKKYFHFWELERLKELAINFFKESNPCGVPYYKDTPRQAIENDISYK